MLEPLDDPLLDPLDDPLLDPLDDPLLEPLDDPLLEPLDDPPEELVPSPPNGPPRGVSLGELQPMTKLSAAMRRRRTGELLAEGAFPPRWCTEYGLARRE